MEEFLFHNQVKQAFNFVFGSILHSDPIGRFVPDRMLLVNLAANLASEPDGTLLFLGNDEIATAQIGSRREDGLHGTRRDARCGAGNPEQRIRNQGPQEPARVVRESARSPSIGWSTLGEKRSDSRSSVGATRATSQSNLRTVGWRRSCCGVHFELNARWTRWVCHSSRCR